MSIQLVTYANQTVTPTNDAIIYEKAVDQNGIFYGCNVTVTSNTVNITGGYGLVCGREFVINSDALTVTLAPSGTLQGRLYVRLDLADADAPIQLLTATGNTLPPLEQDDDVNYTNGTYEMELATFTVGVSALSDVVETYETIKGAKEPPIIIDYYVTPSTQYAANTATWVYSKGWAPTSIAGYTPVGVLTSSPDSSNMLIAQITLITNTYGTTFVGKVNNLSSSAITNTITIPVLYIRNDLIGQ